MNTVDQLKTALPALSTQIRRSRRFKKAAIIAAGAESPRSLVVTTAGEAGLEYHLVHLCDCRPREIDLTGLPAWSEELRPTKWYRLELVIKRFIAGDSVDQLIDAAAGR